MPEPAAGAPATGRDDGGGTAASGPDSPPKDLLTVAGIGRERLLGLLDIAARLRRAPSSESQLLRGRTVVLYFNKPSTRTRLSFETAAVRLGGNPVAIGPHELQLDRGETIEDTARVIASYSAAFVIRTYADEDVRRFAAAAPIPVINALTDRHHPCQAVGDLLTLRDSWGDFDGRKLAFIGDGDNVAHSLIEACALVGLDIVLACPPGYEPDPEVVAGARRLADRPGRITVTNDKFAAAREADAVYTDVWLSMGVPELERASRIHAFRAHQVDAAVMRAAKPEAIFLHCLPAHRGEEVTQEVIDGPQSQVFVQAANRLPTEQAILYSLLTGDFSLSHTETADGG